MNASTDGPGLVGRTLYRLRILHSKDAWRPNMRAMASVAGMHLLALVACLPWLFEWSSLAVAVAGIYVFATLGINVGYHRLLTHRSFACPLWLEHGLSLLGVCCWQGTPMKWVAAHRKHHQHSDETSDPHSPKAGFFWSHMGWFMVYDAALWNMSTYDRYARDLIRDRFYKRLERTGVERRVLLMQWAAFFGIGALIGGLAGGTLLEALRMGLSLLVWGVIVRTVVVWHITWSVNSLTHLWGYRNFATKDDSRNNVFVGFLSNGEGWHNNHHAQPRSAAHGMRWWELDVSYLTIRTLQRLGLAWDIVKPHKGIDPLPAE